MKRFSKHSRNYFFRILLLLFFNFFKKFPLTMHTSESISFSMAFKSTRLSLSTGACLKRIPHRFAALSKPAWAVFGAKMTGFSIPSEWARFLEMAKMLKNLINSKKKNEKSFLIEEKFEKFSKDWNRWKLLKKFFCIFLKH